ncbi:hypothetical protein [Corynebacterium halotolerans]|uniref:Uncharacterized protein n=1 Tax=Corynebacterium halotolerans YIM 70093 = DSM 44683 TaxID=1121362 RepID=M1NY67_9CORY|nr:hypothetical protein [Corynebacterium halotolerans]AGF72445.1 hypothetical protein A605_07215 [Corynebacterium halotolerans YIM 70093 = DSM 44683]
MNLIEDAVAVTAGPSERTPLDRLLGNLASEIYHASGLWWLEDSFGWRCAELFTVDVDPDTRVFEIGSAMDWTNLCRDYPLEVTWGIQNTWHACTGRHGKWLIPDWSQVSRDFDAVHPTVPGCLGTAGKVLDLGDGFATLLAGWDPDEAYWLRGGSRPSEESTSWHQREEDNLWVRGTGKLPDPQV